MIGQALLILGLLGAWTCDGVRDGFHIAQTGQKTWYPSTHGGIVDYGNYHDYVAYETLFVAMAGTGLYLWSKDDPEWWRVAGMTVGSSLVGWMAREWMIDYIPTGDAFRESDPWESNIFGSVPDRSMALQIAAGAVGVGLMTAALAIPGKRANRHTIDVRLLPHGVEMAVSF